MDISPFVESLRRDLARAAEAGADDVRAAAERLAASLDPALRLTLMEALSQAAAEISAEIPDAAVEVRLSGRDPVFVVTRRAGPQTSAEQEPTDEGDGEALSRVTFRLPEALKVRIEALAGRRGQSLNTWLVTAARNAAADDDRHAGGSRHHSARRVRGWAR